MIKSLFLLVLAAVMALAVACGGDDGDNADNADNGGTPGPTAEPTLPSQIPPPVDPDMELTRYDGVNFPYTIYYPSGWRPEMTSETIDRWVLDQEGVGPVAQVNLQCAVSKEGATIRPEDWLTADLELIRLVQTARDEPRDILDLNGRRAVAWSYRVAIPGTTTQSFIWVYYIEGRDGQCAWRLRMDAIGVNPQGYQELLDRIAGEFQPDVGSPAG